VLTLAPPLNLDPTWFRPAAYTISKYGMTIVTLGVAEAERENGVAANCLWPMTAIATAAVRNLMGGEKSIAYCRTTRIVADAAGAILRRSPAEFTGNAVLVEDTLAEERTPTSAPTAPNRDRARSFRTSSSIRGALIKPPTPSPRTPKPCEHIVIDAASPGYA
jgi:NAD(P)-dependent dehydrogenase (short-subunit alcohol dehydrogenase family)